MIAEPQHGRAGLKWTFYDEDVIPAWVAEMDFGLAPAVSEALHDAVDHGITGYPYPDAEEAAARAAADFWADRFDWNVDPSWEFPAPDVIEGIRRCIVHLTRPGSAVILHTPVYFPFFSMVEWAHREIVEVTCTRDEGGRYSLNLEGIEHGLRSGAGSIVLCNPWNPTGVVFEKAELEALVELARRYDARVIADEVHSPIVYGNGRHIPLATLDSERTVTVASASKAWNLPGLRCAQVVLTSPTDREVWRKSFQPYESGAGTFGLLAADAAYSRGREWFDSIMRRLQSNRDLLTSLVAEHTPEAIYTPPQGTYLSWLDLSAYGLDDPAEFLRKKARVAVSAGELFRGDCSRHVRVNFATEPEILIEMMGRIGAALKDVS